MRGLLAHALGTAVGFAADLLTGDPEHAHPVAVFGRAAAAAERVLWRDDRAAGAAHTTLCVAATAGAVAALTHTARRLAPGSAVRWTTSPDTTVPGPRAAPARRPLARAWRRPVGLVARVTPGRWPTPPSGPGPTGRTARATRRLPAAARPAAAVTSARHGGAPAGPGGRWSVADFGALVAEGALSAVVTWAVLGGTSLAREARAVAAALDAGDLDGARRRLPHLCGRDPQHLDADGVARAVVESVAENTSDAVVGALVWAAVAGAPGAAAFRAVNTLDAMVGHRSPRYARFGWAAARLDDVAGWPGARLTALLAAVGGPAPRRALAAWRADAAAHPSPNAGPVEASFAGALGLRLGGTLSYGGRVEHRPVLNASGRPPGPTDIERAVRLSRRVSALALVVTLAARVAWAAWARTGLAVGGGTPSRPHGRAGSRPAHGTGRTGSGRMR